MLICSPQTLSFFNDFCLDLIRDQAVHPANRRSYIDILGASAFCVRIVSALESISRTRNRSMQTAKKSRVARPKIGLRKDAQRSRVGNGSALLAGADCRGLWPRRLKDLLDDHVTDLGGFDNTSAAERSIIRRACVLTVELERFEAKFATVGEATDKDLDLYQRTAGNLRRLLESVGLKRVSKDITLDPLTYSPSEAAE
jgi:hypothetical protein